MKLILLQLLGFFMLNLCIAQSQNGINCPDNAVYTNSDFTLTVNSNFTNPTCEWQRNGQIIGSGNALTTQINTPGQYNFSVTCCTNNSNGILPLQTQISAADDPGPPSIGIPPKCVWVDHPGKSGIEIMRINDGASENTFGGVHQYSRRSAFTADGKYFVMNDGRFINIEDCSVKCDIGTSSEFVLSQLDPDIAFGWSGNNFYKVNCNDVNNKELLYSAPTGLKYYSIGRWEGQQDFNDQYILLHYSAENDDGTAIILDLQNGTTGSTLNLDDVPGVFNWADVSANGTYALVGTNQGVYRFNTPNFTNQTKMEIGQRSGNWHFDMMYDAVGNEIMVMEGTGSISAASQDWAYTILSTNQYVTVDALKTGGITAQSHVSGQAKNRPGWVYVSGGTQTYPNNYLFSMEMKPGNNQVECWGSTYSALESRYKAEPKGSVNPNGDMVVVSTNWNNNGGPVYEILYRPKQSTPSQCETFNCSVTAIDSDNSSKINGCPNQDLIAPASWNVESDLSNGETFVTWTWTLNGQSVNLLDATDPGFGVVDAGPGNYVGTMNYLDINGNNQSQTCTILVVEDSSKINGCPNEDLIAPASWNVQSNLSNGETFVTWTWTLNGQSVNLLDATDPGFGVVDAGPGNYVGTMNYLDTNGNNQSQTCTILVVGDICEGTIYIGNNPTANYYRAGTINSDATILTNNAVEYIGTNQINLINGFTVEEGAVFLADIEACED